jgi:hypothetical protein
VHTWGGPGWSVRGPVLNEGLAAILAVRELADLPFHDASVPEPLQPAPRISRLFVSNQVRRAAAEPWGAWWRIAVAAQTAQHREAPVPPEPPLYGLPTLWWPDPPKFGSLAAAPELKQIVASTWPAVTQWLSDLPEPPPPSGSWPADLISAAESTKGSPIADVTLNLSVLPVAGTSHWILTEDPERRVLHALATADLLTNPGRHSGWLLEALRRIG